MPTIDSFRASQSNRGARRTCQNGECGAAFYDLNRTAITCPVCAAEFDPALVARRETPKPRRGRGFAVTGPRDAVDAPPLDAETAIEDGAAGAVEPDAVDDDTAAAAKDADPEPSGDQILDIEDDDVSPDDGLAPKPAGGHED